MGKHMGTSDAMLRAFFLHFPDNSGLTKVNIAVRRRPQKARLQGHMACFSAAATNSASHWGQLPADILNLIFAHITTRKDLGSVRLTCRIWHQQMLQTTQHLLLEQDPCEAAVAFFRASLPELTSLSLRETRSVFPLRTLTRLTSITLR